MKTIKLIPKYLWQYKFVIAIFFVFAVIFSVIAYLYHLAVEAVLYATLLCAVVAIIIIGINFYYYCKKHVACYNFYNHLVYGGQR